LYLIEPLKNVSGTDSILHNDRFPSGDQNLMKPQKQSASRLTKDSRQGKKASSDSKAKIRARRQRARPSQLSDQSEHDQASVGVEAGPEQVLDTAKAPPTPPPYSPTAVEAGADQVLGPAKAPPTPPPYKPAAVEGGADQVLDTTKAPPAPPPYKRTAQEQVYLARQERREGSTPPAPRLNFAHDNRGMRLMTDHPDPTIVKKLVMETLGTADPFFFAGLEQQLIDLTGGESEDEVKALNFALSYIISGRPEDELETMHLFQMAIVDMALKRNAKEAFRLQRSIDVVLSNRRRSHPLPVKTRDPVEQPNEKFLAEALACKDTAHRAIEKLARIHAHQLMALPRHRIAKAIAKKLAASEDMSSKQPINDNSGGNKDSAADQPESGLKVVPLRGAKS
jgi:hypothetical protein